jgi:hypothetical protein
VPLPSFGAVAGRRALTRSVIDAAEFEPMGKRATED